ncbi:hypothetical protein PUP68_07465 [Pseudomonas chlororaphis]|uniref:hypothetical protein n=1 Tax=Pseudomonas chlororaphis TaxID=587753 RepID=UPI0023682560|nr:hypothetical protein [Pseudomonas chlororaphis]WDG80012.1 hypothetical protein PUP77_04775 [Pseudomonas chlororaphis]WDG86935.1 hypothetical protein PUP68_07465 [Pseudomonas chlororaphis]
MYTLTLPPDARSRLSDQIITNGEFAHSLYAENDVSYATAYIVVEQCAKAVLVRVALGSSVNTITLVQRKDTGERVARFLEELANGVSPSTVPEDGEHLLVSDTELVLREAVRLRQGTYYLPAEGGEYLCLLLCPSTSDPTRSVFRFELDSIGITLPLLLPCDRGQAFELLAGCVQELIANYRCAA